MKRVLLLLFAMMCILCGCVDVKASDYEKTQSIVDSVLGDSESESLDISGILAEQSSEQE